MLIGIISPSSMRSAWVLFELGARWGAGKTLAPVLAPGSPSDLLQGPLAELNALSCSNPAQLHELVRDIGRHLGIAPNSPDSYQDQMDAFASMQTQKSENLDRATGMEGLSSSDLVILFRQSLLERLRAEGELTLSLRREAETANLPPSALKAEIHKLAAESVAAGSRGQHRTSPRRARPRRGSARKRRRPHVGNQRMRELDAAEEGETVRMDRNGRPGADIVPVKAAMPAWKKPSWRLSGQSEPRRRGPG